MACHGDARTSGRRKCVRGRVFFSLYLRFPIYPADGGKLIGGVRRERGLLGETHAWMAVLAVTLLSNDFSVIIHDPSVLIEGVLFRARYLGSTQLVCEGQPTKATRMMQAEEAVARIKVSFGGARLARSSPTQPWFAVSSLVCTTATTVTTSTPRY